MQKADMRYRWIVSYMQICLQCTVSPSVRLRSRSLDSRRQKVATARLCLGVTIRQSAQCVKLIRAWHKRMQL